jgi:hypothetical protein
MRIALVAALIVLAGASCGGNDEPSSEPVAEPVPTTAGYSRIGCDVPSACSTANAEETLKRCPASRLDAPGRKTRKRLERLLARIERVDLHNKQVDEAYAAAMRALEDPSARVFRRRLR